MYVHSFLAIIFLLQSFAAVADVHQFQQTPTQHEALAEHVHKLADDADQQDVLQDCNHCCHCHTPGASALLVSFFHVLQINSISVIFMNTDQYSSQPSVSLYRPPIV